MIEGWRVNSPLGDLVQMALLCAAGDMKPVIEWLQLQGCQICSQREKEFVVKGKTGITIGFLPMDPIGCAVQLAFAMQGEVWPLVYPGFLEEVNRAWKSQIALLKG